MVRLCSALCLMLLLTPNAGAEDLIKAEAAVKKIFPSATVVEYRELTLTQEQMRAVEQAADITFGESHLPHLVVHIVKEGGSIAGYAFEDTVIGKWGPIHFLVGLDPSGKIQQTVILDYKEIRGKPIAKKRFLNQYKGKTLNNKLMLRKDIDGVTGATISSRSLTDGIRKIVHLFELIKPDLAK
jgi:Na+-translocating ferredoxin:NAD+ oxidoreductase RnfG subunit